MVGTCRGIAVSDNKGRYMMLNSKIVKQLGLHDKKEVYRSLHDDF